VSDYPLGFRGSRLLALHSQVMASGRLTHRQMDRPLPSVNYTLHRSRLRGTPDRVLQSQELFQAIVQTPSLHSVYRRWAGESLPWRPDGSTDSRLALAEFDQMLQQWRSEHPDGTQRQLAEHIFHWFTDPQGFGMVHDENAGERGFSELAGLRRGDCTEFTFGLLTFYRRAGIEARPLWVGVDMDGLSTVHVVTEIRIGSQRFNVDPIFGRFHAPHRQTAPLSDRELLGHYWSNRAQDLVSRDPRRARVYFDRALQVDPYNPHIRVARADFFRDQMGDRDRARTEIQAALRIDRNFSPAHLRLGNWAFAQDQFGQALLHYQRALRNDPQNLTAMDNRARLLVRLGRLVQAGEQISQIRKLNPGYHGLNSLETLVRNPHQIWGPLPPNPFGTTPKAVSTKSE
jgi:hypothetical protein